VLYGRSHLFIHLSRIGALIDITGAYHVE